MVEPGNQDDREYARLHISANPFGINIDGQGTISWHDLIEAGDTIEQVLKHRN